VSVYEFNPITDPRWPELVQRHPASSIFQTSGWLRALQHTYGYSPIAFTTSAPSSELKNGIVFCRVSSWLTGSRLVSLPFSDHCEPLVENQAHLSDISDRLVAAFGKASWRYIEIRPRNLSGEALQTHFGQSGKFCFHSLDLRRSLAELYAALHKSCIQRRILRAERAGLCYSEGRSELQLRKFYRLFVLTRCRHQVPPPPLAWFHNLLSCLGDAAVIRLVEMANETAAGIFTIAHRNVTVYKYGAFDERFKHLGAVPFLFWKTIQDVRQNGFAELDLGRSDYDTPGLILFKDRLGAERSSLTYLRYPAPCADARQLRSTWLARKAFGRVPESILIGAGSLLYRHIG
jgi:hypothetical protein